MSKENSVIEADFKTIQERTLPIIATEIMVIEQQVTKVTMEGAIEIGKRLQEAKEKVEHGEFENWCKENLDYSKRTAERFMQIATAYEDEASAYAKATTLSHLSISKAIKLLQVPEEEVEEFVEAHDVETMSVSELESEIKELKKESKQLQKEKTEMASEVDEANKQKADAEDKFEKANKKLEKLKEDIKALQESQQEAIDKAVADNREAVYQEAKSEALDEINEQNKENGRLQTENEELKNKLENSGQIYLLKGYSEVIQDAFSKALETIKDASDKEMMEKMNNAMKQVLETCLKQLEA